MSEFTDYCSRYYKLTQLLAKREERLKKLLADTPFYSGQTSLSDIDDIISYYRMAQEAKAETDDTFTELKSAERKILMIMRHFNIEPGTVLTGIIPGELEYELYINENDAIHITKTKDLAPLVDAPNVITIKLCGKDGGVG